MIKQVLIVGAVVISTIPAYANTISIPMEARQLVALPEDGENKILGVHLNDVVNNFPKAIAGLPNINVYMKSNPELFFPYGSIQKVHNVHISKVPDLRSGVMTLELTGFVKYKDQTRFEKVQVAYTNNAKKMDDVSVTLKESISINDTDFVIQVGLVERKVIFEDKTNSIKFVMPTGVGSFDEGVMNEGQYSLLTPRFKEGYIDRRTVISKREKPRYFANKPFIRLLKGNDLSTDMTPIGFHTEINDSFVRGFDSHGCMRLRDQDLFALHDLIMDGTRQKTPITIAYRLSDKMDHPAGKRNKGYKAVVNSGTKESPFFPIDKDNLVQTGYKSKEAPLDLLKDDPLDHYEDIFDYDTIRQSRDQNARRKEECSELVDSSDKKAYEACLNKGKRRDSVGDKIYRKWVH